MESYLLEVKNVLRSILISSPLIINVSELDSDFKEQMGIKIPFQKLGFKSLLEFLNSIPDVLTVNGKDEYSNVQLVFSEKSAHVSDLVMKQKVSTYRPGKFYSQKKKSTRNKKEETGRQSNEILKSSKPVQSKETLKYQKPVRPDYEYSSRMWKKNNNLKNKCSIDEISTNTEIGNVLKKKNASKVTKKSTDSEVNLKASTECSKVENISPKVIIFPESYSNSEKMSHRFSNNQYSSSLQNNRKVKNSTEEYPSCPSTTGIKNDARRMRYFDSSCNTKSEQNSKKNNKSSYSKKNNSTFGVHIDAGHSSGRTKIYVEESGNFTKNTNNYWKTQRDRKKKFHNGKNPLSQENVQNFIPEHIKDNLQKLISDYPDGICCAELPIAYKNLFGEELCYQNYGFFNLICLCLDLNNIFHCVKESSYDYKLYDAKKPLHEIKIEEEVSFHEEIDTKTSTERPSAMPDMHWGSFDFCVPEDATKLGFSMDRVQAADLLTSRMEVDVVVAEIYDISKFWIILDYAKLDSLMKHMETFYKLTNNKQKYLVPRSLLEAGLNCVVLYKGVFHRSVILDRMSDEEYVKVYYFDYGTLGMVPKSEVWYLVRQFAELPMQAIRSRLADVYPPYACSAWSPSANYEFSTLCCMKRLKAIIMRVDRKRNLCDLKLIKGTENISNILIAKNHAISVNQPQKKNIEDPNCKPKVQFVHLFPVFEEIENWLVPSVEQVAEFLNTSVTADFLYSQYFTRTSFKKTIEHIENKKKTISKNKPLVKYVQKTDSLYSHGSDEMNKIAYGALWEYFATDSEWNLGVEEQICIEDHPVVTEQCETKSNENRLMDIKNDELLIGILRQARMRRSLCDQENDLNLNSVSNSVKLDNAIGKAIKIAEETNFNTSTVNNKPSSTDINQDFEKLCDFTKIENYLPETDSSRGASKKSLSSDLDNKFKKSSDSCCTNLLLVPEFEKSQEELEKIRNQKRCLMTSTNNSLFDKILDLPNSDIVISDTVCDLIQFDIEQSLSEKNGESKCNLDSESATVGDPDIENAEEYTQSKISETYEKIQTEDTNESVPSKSNDMRENDEKKVIISDTSIHQRISPTYSYSAEIKQELRMNDSQKSSNFIEHKDSSDNDDSIVVLVSPEEEQFLLTEDDQNTSYNDSVVMDSSVLKQELSASIPHIDSSSNSDSIVVLVSAEQEKLLKSKDEGLSPSDVYQTGESLDCNSYVVKDSVDLNSSIDMGLKTSNSTSMFQSCYSVMANSLDNETSFKTFNDNRNMDNSSTPIQNENDIYENMSISENDDVMNCTPTSSIDARSISRLSFVSGEWLCTETPTGQSKNRSDSPIIHNSKMEAPLENNAVKTGSLKNDVSSNCVPNIEQSQVKPSERVQETLPSTSGMNYQPFVQVPQYVVHPSVPHMGYIQQPFATTQIMYPFGNQPNYFIPNVTHPRIQFPLQQQAIVNEVAKNHSNHPIVIFNYTVLPPLITNATNNTDGRK